MPFISLYARHDLSDNLLSEQNVKDGHIVTIVSDCYKFENGVLVHTATETEILSQNLTLIRLDYDKILNSFISSKIRKVSALSDLIRKIAPDVILYHGCCGYELLTAAKYKEHHPKIKLYVAAITRFQRFRDEWLSRHILHGDVQPVYCKKGFAIY